MLNDGVAEAESVPSFLIECLVWNADVAAFSKDSYSAIIRYIIANLWNNTRKDADCQKWVEVNRMKWLFRDSQPWTRDDANRFLQAAWIYIGYK